MIKKDGKNFFEALQGKRFLKGEEMFSAFLILEV
jgi:hypothetical protein